MANWRKVLILSLQIFTVSSLNVKILSGEWTLEDPTGQYNHLKATVPGGIYTDLMNNNIIGDVFYGSNDTETRWVAHRNWTYRHEFIVDDAFLGHNSINLVFEGLDTFATILVNDAEIGATQNMFLRYIFQIKDNLQVGNNSLEVRFASPVLIANASASNQGYDVPPNCPSTTQNGECHVNQIRKMQASFSWDWGPALPSMGIWKDVYLEALNSSVIRYLLVDYRDAPNDSWMIIISTYLSARKDQSVEGTLVFVLETDVSLIQEVLVVKKRNTGDDGQVQVDLAFAIPKLIVRKWWPNGYGEPKLYNLSATFRSGSEMSYKSVRIGFRKIQLIQEPVGSGLSFYFKVNDVPIFAKGANEIPINILPEKGQDPGTISRLLESAHAANMNMLRVWGGGVYESDYFYEKTDELGILVWQDFMFACAMYPTYSEFLNNVRSEVRHQVRRLRSHPSIALWAGNNENEIALMSNWYGTYTNSTLYKEDYLTLYIDTIRAELFNVTNNVIFVSSSPSNGKESEEEGYLAANPGNPLFGDVHFYNYLTNSLDVKTYPVPRFASEFGYQSLPEVDSWLAATDNTSDLDPSSDFMSHRQHHTLGLIENNLLIGYQLKLNKTIADYYKTYIFYSQIVQAMSIKFETEYYRSFMGRTDSEGRGNTMGALFWQLNDVWVAPTWSGIDFSGKWKMLQHFAKDFFAPTIITGYLDAARQLHMFVVSEMASLLDSPIEVSVVIDVYNWSSFNPVDSVLVNISLEYGRSVALDTINTDDYLQALSCGSLATARTNCFFYLSVLSGNSVIAPHNLVLATSLKSSKLARTNVGASAIAQVDDQGTKFDVTVAVDGISLFVWLNSHQVRGRFSENGFVQVVPEKNVTFHAEEATSADALREAITIDHLNNLDYQ